MTNTAPTIQTLSEEFQVSFTPTFATDGWETSLLPKYQSARQHNVQTIKISLQPLKDMLLKAFSGRKKGFSSMAMAVVRLFL